MLIATCFFSPEKFLHLLKGAPPTDLSGIILNPKQAFHGRFLLSGKGSPWKVMLKAACYADFFLVFSVFCQGLWDPLYDLNIDLRRCPSIVLLLRYNSLALFLGSEICEPLGSPRCSQHIRQRCSEPRLGKSLNLKCVRACSPSRVCISRKFCKSKCVTSHGSSICPCGK